MKEIPIFFTFDRYYVLAACVAFFTLLRNASKSYKYKLYVVHTDLKESHICRIKKVISFFPNAEVVFRKVLMYDVKWENLKNKSHFSKEIFYKLIAAEMFPEYDRILFSDVDVIFLNDISSSFFVYPDEDFYFAGTRPILRNEGLCRYKDAFTKEEIQIINDYEISAGYMLINLSCIRRDNKQKELVHYFQENSGRLILPEQDCIALCCNTGIRFLPYKYVVCAFQYSLSFNELEFNSNNKDLENRMYAYQCYIEMLRDVVQLHYPGLNKPWNNPFVHRYKDWILSCIQSHQFKYYLSMQFIFLLQRIKRYSLVRFFNKIKNVFKIE